MAFSGRAFRGLMFRAFSSGFSFNAFYRSSREHGTSYRRSDMLADWSDVKNEVVNRKHLQTLQSGDIPKHVELTESTYKYTQPFIYKAAVGVQVAEGAVTSERFVTVLSSKALTMGEILDQIRSKWPGYEYGKSERLVTIEPTAALHYIA
jgi:hypothetical protein